MKFHIVLFFILIVFPKLVGCFAFSLSILKEVKSTFINPAPDNILLLGNGLLDIF